MIVGNFDSQERGDCLKNGKQPHHESRMGKLLEPVGFT
jgi:hypothetical protein